MSAWNKADDGELGGELTVSNLRMMTEDQQQGILFKAIRGTCHRSNVIQSRSLLLIYF